MKKELWNRFTAEEEYDTSMVDLYERNLFWASKNRDIFNPTVSDYLIENGLEPNYPDNKEFAICLTHDIDTLFSDNTAKQYLTQGIKQLIKLNLKGAFSAFKEIGQRRIIPNFHVSKTLEIEKKYGAKSSSYFLSLSKGEQDFNYEPSEIPEVFEMIKASGGEIGLHGGHQAYGSLEKLKSEKEKLEAASGQKVVGYRNHYLRFKTPYTWQYLDQLGFDYDTTFGYADCVGFRNGMCHPFQPYDLKQNKFLDLIELPLIIMECSLWARYMGISEEKQFNFCKDLIDKVAERKGVLTLLWHNTEMQGHNGALYDAILKYAHEKNAWLTTGKEITDHWKNQKLHEKSNEILKSLME